MLPTARMVAQSLSAVARSNTITRQRVLDSVEANDRLHEMLPRDEISRELSRRKAASCVANNSQCQTYLKLV